MYSLPQQIEVCPRETAESDSDSKGQYMVQAEEQPEPSKFACSS